MDSWLAKFTAFTVVSVVAVTLALFMIIQALSFNTKTSFLLGVPFEIPVMLIGTTLIGLADN